MEHGWPSVLAGLHRASVVHVFEGYKGENEEWSEHPIDALHVAYFEDTDLHPYEALDAEIGSMGGDRGWLIRVSGAYGGDKEEEAGTKEAALAAAKKLIWKARDERKEGQRRREARRAEKVRAIKAEIRATGRPRKKRKKNPRQMTTRELCSLGDKSARSELQRRGRNPRSGKRNPQSRGDAMEWVVVAPWDYEHALRGEMGVMLMRGHGTSFTLRERFIDPKDLSEGYAISPLGPPKPAFEVTVWGVPSDSSRASAAIRSRLEVYGIVLGPTRKRKR